VEYSLKEQLEESYGIYALTVIKGRALPDIRDGLKPVQRRILYAAFEGGYRHNKPFRKSAKLVGEVLGKYHPHGDGSVYETLVNLIQPFDMSAPLMQGHGNFGSIDGDRAAAYRYTEARLAHIAEYMLYDWDKDTVALCRNYDNSLEMPMVLPSQFPNILVNGAVGIAVGMATNIPPHNLGEVLQATIAVLNNEDISLDEVMQFIKGPDFPTGGALYCGSQLKTGYMTGRGKAVLRGSCYEEINKNKTSIIIDSIPYQVIKPKLIETITNLIDEGSFSDIADVRDESGKDIRIVLELKKDANVEIIKQKLFTQTQLQISVNLNMIAIHNDKPITFGLLDALKIFLQFREEVVIKRAEYILNKNFNKAHVAVGLILATTELDAIISIIRGSHDVEEATQKLRAIAWMSHQYQIILKILPNYITNEPYHFSEEQIKAILDLKLQRLTKLERNSLIDDLSELAKIITEQQKIIQDREYRKTIMIAEFNHLIEKFAVPRRTQLLDSIDTRDVSVEKEDIVIVITANGYIKRINLEEYKVQNRGGKGKIGHAKTEDQVLNIFTTHTLAEILFFTNTGKVFSMQAHELPNCSISARGRAALNLFKLEKGEKITTILPLEENAIGKYLVFVTTKGTIRRNAITDFQNIRANGKIAMQLEADNMLHNVLIMTESDEILLTSSGGHSIRFNISDVRVFSGRQSEGIRAIYLEKNDHIIGSTKIDNASIQILSITENGYGKRSNVDEYRKIKRGGKGTKTMNINAKTGKIIQTFAVDEADEVLLMSKNGQTIRISANAIRKTGRVASGVILMRMADNDAISLAMPIFCLN
jgi:DNA gyrase subunit A